MRKEVPGIIWFLHVRVGIAFLRMDKVGKLQRVADKKDRRVITDQVVVAVFSIKLQSKAARVAHGVRGAQLERHGGEAQEHLGALTNLSQKLCFGKTTDVVGNFKISIGTRPARVHHALGDALTIEAR